MMEYCFKKEYQNPEMMFQLKWKALKETNNAAILVFIHDCKELGRYNTDEYKIERIIPCCGNSFFRFTNYKTKEIIEINDIPFLYSSSSSILVEAATDKAIVEANEWLNKNGYIEIKDDN